MMRRKAAVPRRCAGEGGFTVTELIVYIVVALVVVGAIYQLLMGQNRLYMKQRELQDVRGSLRAAASFLAFEFRGASVLNGDLSGITADSVMIRSVMGTGVVCGTHDSKPRVALWNVDGQIDNTLADSVVIFAAGNADSHYLGFDDGWLIAPLGQVWETASLGEMSWCDWGDGLSVEPDRVAEVSLYPKVLSGPFDIQPQSPVAPGLSVTFLVTHPDLTCGDFGGDSARFYAEVGTQVDEGPLGGCTFAVNLPTDADQLEIQIRFLRGDQNPPDEWEGTVKWIFDSVKLPESVKTGGTFRAFRWVQYGTFFEDGRWWLGAKDVGSSSYEKLTGPLRAPADSGLVFVYYDRAGNPTTDPAAVHTVGIVLRAESLGQVPRPGLAPAVEEDTLSLRVLLRG